MGEFVKYMIFGIIFALGAGYLLGQSQESREFESRIMVVDVNTKEHVKIKEIKTYPSFKVSKNELTAGSGNIYFKTASKTTALVKVKAEGYKTKWKIMRIDSSKVNYIEILKKGEKHSTDPVKIKEQKQENEKDPKIDLKPNI